MVSTYTANIGLEEPARGDQVGTWDTPVNANMTLIDLVDGGISNIALAGAGVVLAAAQYQCNQISFSSTLTASVAITFPTSFKKTYFVQHACHGSSAFIITLKTTAAGGRIIGLPPGEIISVGNDGTHMYYTNLGRVGSYLDYAGSSVPAWIAAGTIPPYLNCDGSVFSSATHPQLATILGGTTLPDRRGTAGYTLNQGTGRLTTALGGLDGDTILSKKTTQATLSTSNLPAYTPTGTVAVLVKSSLVPTVAATGGSVNAVALGTAGGLFTFPGSLPATGSFTGVAQGGTSNVVPVGSATVYGLTLIRSA